MKLFLALAILSCSGLAHGKVRILGKEELSKLIQSNHCTLEISRAGEPTEVRDINSEMRASEKEPFWKIGSTNSEVINRFIIFNNPQDGAVLAIPNSFKTQFGNGHSLFIWMTATEDNRFWKVIFEWKDQRLNYYPDDEQFADNSIIGKDFTLDLSEDGCGKFLFRCQP